MTGLLVNAFVYTGSGGGSVIKRVRGNLRLRRPRSSRGYPQQHVVVVDDDVISSCAVDDKLEVDVYRAQNGTKPSYNSVSNSYAPAVTATE